MLQAYVSSVSDVFIWMLHAFHLDVAKVDRDVAHVVMVILVCCNCMFQMFYLFFQTYVASVFIWMFHMFHTYVTGVLSGCSVCLPWFQVFFQVFFASVSYVYFKYFICLQTYVVSVVSECFKNKTGVAHIAMHVRKRKGGERSLHVVWWHGQPPGGIDPRVGARNTDAGRGVLARAWSVGARKTDCSVDVDVGALVSVSVIKVKEI